MEGLKSSGVYTIQVLTDSGNMYRGKQVVK